MPANHPLHLCVKSPWIHFVLNWWFVCQLRLMNLSLPDPQERSLKLSLTRKFVLNCWEKVFFFFFLSLNWICSSVLCFGFLAARHVGSQLPDQGSNPHPLHWKVKSQPLDHWTTGEVPESIFFFLKLIPTLSFSFEDYFLFFCLMKMRNIWSTSVLFGLLENQFCRFFSSHFIFFHLEHVIF